MAVVLYRCLTGRCPFESDSSIELVHSVPRAERPSLVSLRPELPPTLDEWAKIALCPDPDGRFDNVEAMWKAFLRAGDAPIADRITPVMPLEVPSSKAQVG